MLWRYRSPGADELLLAPPDLRAHDASFADEVAAGSFGLAGAVADLRGRSPFAIPPPSPAWARELHGFGWLRHLDGATVRRGQEDRPQARRRLDQAQPRARWSWPGSPRSWAAASSPGCRTRPCCSMAPSRKRYAAVMRSLTDQITYLSTSWRDAPDGSPRLVALIGLVHADLCIAGHDRRLAQSQKLLVAELERQIPPDGGHISRNPWALVELLLDLLPLRRCFAARAKTPDAGAARDHPADDGDAASPSPRRRHAGALQRHGAGRARRARHRACLRRRPAGGPRRAGALRVRAAGARLPRSSSSMPGRRRRWSLRAPPARAASSFELSSGSELVLVNGGVPGEIEASRRIVARATPNHNTLCLGEQSSAKLVRDARLEREIGAPPLRHPDHVTCAVREAEGAIELRGLPRRLRRALGPRAHAHA